MKLSSIILFFLLLSMVNVAFAQDGYSVEPYSPQSGPTDILGANITISFFDLPLYIQIAWIVSVLGAIFGTIKFGPFILGKVRTVLQNRNRSVILEYIENNPGCTLANLLNDTEMNRGTARHHLKLLLIERKVVLKKTGKLSYLFANGSVSIERKQIYGYIRNPSKRKILDAILIMPGISNKELAENLQMSPSTVSWHLQPLIEEEMIVSQWDGRYQNYFILPEVEDVMKKDGK